MTADAADPADAIADELYGLDRDEFIAARDERAAQARAAGDKDLAKRIKALRKPTLAAWLVNRLAREEPDEVARLGKLGDELRQAHSELAGAALRTLSRRRHELVQSLTDRAERLAESAVSESVSREVYDTLDAALTDPDSADAVAEGRITTALQPGDVFSGDWLATGPAAPRAKPATAKPKRKAPARDGTSAREDGARADDERQRKAAARREAENERRRRREELKRARDEAVRARSERDEARRELRAAERDEAKARKRTEAARQALDSAESRVADAETAVDELHQPLRWE